MGHDDRGPPAPRDRDERARHVCLLPPHEQGASDRRAAQRAAGRVESGRRRDGEREQPDGAVPHERGGGVGVVMVVERKHAVDEEQCAAGAGDGERRRRVLSVESEQPAGAARVHAAEYAGGRRASA